MNYDERVNLINSLQEAVVSDANKQKQVVKRYNASTGTIYCDNNVEYDKEAIVQARKSFEERRVKCDRLQDHEGVKLCDVAVAIMEVYLNHFIDED